VTTKIADKEEELIERVIVRLNAVLTGVVLGLLCGIGLFLATMWLVLKGGPHPGVHLILLSQYFPGYAISVLGSLVGFFYAFLIGFLTGCLLGFVYNKIAR
jgi:ABC-type nitrate/sulfonate/bicarbonate transport system permease component